MGKLLLGLVLFIVSFSYGAEFYCPKGGTLTVLIKKETPTGKVICVKNRFHFAGYVALPLKPNEIIFAQCNKPKKGGDK